jgi:hypothetical protein
MKCSVQIGGKGITPNLHMNYVATTHLHIHYNYCNQERVMCMEKYVEIVEIMVARGEKVTLQSVRRVAGKGSFTTISDAIKLVLNRGLIPMEVSGPVPERLMDVTKDLWQEACKLASEAVASERLALHSARVAGQENQHELTALADLLAIQVDDLNVQIESLQAEKIPA